MKELLVSVCMITYNHEDFIEEALNSILSQIVDFKVQVVVCDDFSNDNTRSIINKYKSIDLENFSFKTNYNNKNIGVAENFKLALELCDGKYIALCEGDDAWGDKYKLSKQVLFLETNTQFIASFHDSHFYNKYSDLVYGFVLKNNSKRNLNFEDFISGNHTLPTQSVIFRKIFTSLPNEFKLIPNPDIFLFSFLSKSGKFYFQSTIFHSFYRLHSGGYFSTQSRYLQTVGNKDTFKILLNIFPDNYLLKKNILIKIFSSYIYSIKERMYLESFFLIKEYIFFIVKNPILIVPGFKFPIKVLNTYFFSK